PSLLSTAPSTTSLYPLSLHDALPILALSAGVHARPSLMPALHLLVVPQIGHGWISVLHVPPGQSAVVMQPKLAFEPLSHLLDSRSEEHTSELQSPYDLVCRLLLEKKK